MKKVFSSASEVCHVWASRRQSEGRAGNVFFDGDTIYSYGKHFPIARHVADDTILFATQGYSKSTSKHIGRVRFAASHKLKVYCEDPESSIARNVSLERDNVEDKLALIAATKHKVRIRNLSAELLHITERVRALCVLSSQIDAEPVAFPEWANLPNDLKIAADKFAAEVAAIKEAARIAKEAAIAKDLEDEKDKLKYWKRGDPLRLSTLAGRLPVALRIKDGNIQTSHGASVPIEDVKPELWDVIQAVRKRGVLLPLLPAIRLGHYSASRVEADGTLIVGCHTIPFSELRKMAKVLWPTRQAEEVVA